MARRRVADPVTVHSWEEADALLGQIAERQREVTRIELEMNQRIAVLKENAKPPSKSIRQRLPQAKSSWHFLQPNTGRTLARARASP